MEKDDKVKILQKYSGRCAYCGCQLTEETVLTDILPSENPDEELQVPACKVCYENRQGKSLQEFRHFIANTTEELKANQMYRLGMQYNRFTVSRSPVEFYFERYTGTAKALAKKLDKRPYGEEISRNEELVAKEAGLVVVFGYSDDIVEFAGAISYELGCFDGGTIWIQPDGTVTGKKPNKKSKRLDAAWCGDYEYTEDGDALVIPWTFKIDLPHEEFMILEDGEPFCRGIIFSLRDLQDSVQNAEE